MKLYSPPVQSPVLSKDTLEVLERHIQQEMLPVDFKQTVQQFYWPVVVDMVQAMAKRSKPTPYFLGIQGTQGSGKSTLASFLKLILEHEFKKNCLVLSLDDFYLTKAERQTLSQTVHPLLATRGVPGTHDTALLQHTLQSIQELKDGESLEVVTFNKALDDRADSVDWQKVSTKQDVVILEGWCVGVSAQAPSVLSGPVNALEAKEDSAATWRTYVNDQIQAHYQTIYDAFDGFLMLAAPSFECVFQWRLKQEEKLINKLKKAGKSTADTMNSEQIKRFISHYQRLTEHAFATLPSKADWVLRLHSNHAITELSRRG